ncbi:MAG: type IX secretion system membrane protein PorP/SprF [Bacteroidota bacterium]
MYEIKKLEALDALNFKKVIYIRINPLAMKKTLLKLTLWLFIPFTALAQDPQFSQFYANPLYTNPAFAGASNNIRFTIIGRDQYTSINKNYKTAGASLDAQVNALNGGLGMMATMDIAGDGNLTTNIFSGIYSYSVSLSKKVTMRAGIQASYYQRTYDFSKFRFGDQIDDQYGFILPTNEARGLQQINLLNFGSGLLIYSNRLFGGVAIHNLTEPNQSFYSPNSSADEFKLPRRYTVHAGANIPVTNSRFEDERVILSPNILYMQQRNFNQLNLGFYVKKQALTAGMWFRQTSKNSDALIFLVGLKFPKFRVGYSYDITVSGARTATQGSHELSMAFEIKPKKKEARRTTKAMRCPEF